MEELEILQEMSEPSLNVLDPHLVELLNQIISQLNTIMTLIFIFIVLSLAIMFIVLIWTLMKRFIEQY